MQCYFLKAFARNLAVEVFALKAHDGVMQGLEKMLPKLQRLDLTHSCPAVLAEQQAMQMGPQLLGEEFAQLTSLRDLRLTNIRAARGLAVPPHLQTLWLSNLKLLDVRAPSK